MSTTTNLGLYKHDNVDSNENEFDIEKALNENWDKIDDKVGNIEAAIQQKNITGTEFKTGRMYNGEEEYAKVIDISPLPNATSKTVAHGLTYANIHIHKIEGCADDGTGYVTLPLPYVSATASELIKLDQVGPNIRVVTSNDRSAYVNATATIYYTYNS